MRARSMQAGSSVNVLQRRQHTGVGVNQPGEKGCARSVGREVMQAIRTKRCRRALQIECFVAADLVACNALPCIRSSSSDQSFHQ